MKAFPSVFVTLTVLSVAILLYSKFIVFKNIQDSSYPEFSFLGISKNRFNRIGNESASSLSSLHSPPSKPLESKVAIVFAGSARSFICAKVHWTIKVNLIDALESETFVFVRVSTEDNINIGASGNGR